MWLHGVLMCIHVMEEMEQVQLLQMFVEMVGGKKERIVMMEIKIQVMAAQRTVKR